MPPGNQADPYQGWITFTTARSGRSSGQCQYRCKCGQTQWNATSRIAHDLARAHVAVHGVVIEADMGPVAPRVAGTLSSGSRTAERKGDVAWWQVPGAAEAAIDGLRRQ